MKSKKQNKVKKTDWYSKAEKQTFETLPDFIKSVEESFPGYEKMSVSDDFETGMKYYTNGIIGGLLISPAAFPCICAQI